MRKARGVALAATAVAVMAAWAIALRAEVDDAPAWRLGGGVTAAVPRGDTIYVGGAFTRLYTPSTVQDQFYDFVTGQVRQGCARSTNELRSLSGVTDGRGGLLVAVQPGDEFADENGPFEPPPFSTIVRIAETCQWDRGFAAGGIDPSAPFDLTIGQPARVGGVVVATNAVIGPDGMFLRAQAAAFDATSGGRLSYKFYDGVTELGVLGATATRVIVRVRSGFGGLYVLGALDPSTLTLTQSSTVLADESIGVRSWVRGDVLYRARPAPSNLLEAYDLTTLQPRAGWTAPVVPALADLEVVGGRVFLAARVVGNQTLMPPAALLAASGAVDTSWAPPALTRLITDPSGPYEPVLSALATDGLRLYFSGDFERVGSVERDGVAALGAASGGLDAWTPAPFDVAPIEATTTALLATRPTGANRTARRFLAAVDRADGTLREWNPNDPARELRHTPSPIAALAADNSHVYFAGATTGEVRRAHPTTADVDEEWRVVVTRADGSPGLVTAMIVANGQLYLGGEFDRIAGRTFGATARRAVAAVRLDGALSEWAPVLEGPAGVPLVRALLALNGIVYLGGEFTAVANSFRTGFAAVDAFSGTPTPYEMIVQGETRISGLATDGERIYVAGVSFGAPLAGAVSVPELSLTYFGPTSSVVPDGAAYVAGRFYAGLEYDPEAGVPTERETRWGRVVADTQGLVHLPDDAPLEYYVALPGNPPGPPELAATAVDNTVSVSWTPSLSGGAPSSYILRAGSAPGRADLAVIPIRGTTRYTTVAPTGLYYLTVVARNGYGESAPSNEVPVQSGCLTAPAVPGTLSYLTAAANVALVWQPALGASSYVIEAGQSPGSANLGGIPVANVTSFATAAPLGTYYVRVRAVNRCGVSGASNEVAIVLDGSTSVPSTPDAPSAAVNGRTVTLRWAPATTGGLPLGYHLEAGSTPGGVIALFPTAASELVVGSVPPGTYYVRVRAVNAAGRSAPTSDIVVTVP